MDVVEEVEVVVVAVIEVKEEVEVVVALEKAWTRRRVGDTTGTEKNPTEGNYG